MDKSFFFFKFFKRYFVRKWAFVKALEQDKQYFFDFFKRYFGEEAVNKNVLDYGCGMGEIIRFARQKGFSFWGVDNYYDDELPDYDLQHLDLRVQQYVKLLDPSGKCPFENESFDFIYSNQVIEHIDDLYHTVEEFYRILKPGGIMLHNFPCKELLNEAHFSVPFIHKIRHKKIRFYLLNSYYALGIGLHRESRGKNEWIADTLNFIDNNCHYRSEYTILQYFKNYFMIRKINKQKKIYNLKNKTKWIHKVIVRIVYIMPEFLINIIQKYYGSVMIFIIKRDNC